MPSFMEKSSLPTITHTHTHTHTPSLSLSLSPVGIFPCTTIVHAPLEEATLRVNIQCVQPSLFFTVQEGLESRDHVIFLYSSWHKAWHTLGAQ